MIACLVVGSILLTYGGYGRVSFGADDAIVPNEETAKHLTNEFWSEINRLGAMSAMNEEKLKTEQTV
jgi:hypothetical protein